MELTPGQSDSFIQVQKDGTHMYKRKGLQKPQKIRRLKMKKLTGGSSWWG